MPNNNHRQRDAVVALDEITARDLRDTLGSITRDIPGNTVTITPAEAPIRPFGFDVELPNVQHVDVTPRPSLFSDYYNALVQGYFGDRYSQAENKTDDWYIPEKGGD